MPIISPIVDLETSFGSQSVVDCMAVVSISEYIPPLASSIRYRKKSALSTGNERALYASTTCGTDA